ncbi:unnamed protein product [Plutella xylostella]|uniref:(diamondback moth) hypothetical protein n=1 Tax=Plutella xylostella TaxID=51655 RepID=A0A8S4FYZ4_PLUXY|nr:unnamed protein product [Plutella xylostella]
MSEAENLPTSAAVAEDAVVSAKINLEDFVDDGKNKKTLACKYCGCKILENGCGKYVHLERSLPAELQDKRKTDGYVHEKLVHYFIVENMYTFDNIGFTHTIDETKYLSCADCDAGPIGYFDVESKHSYVGMTRVKHI